MKKNSWIWLIIIGMIFSIVPVHTGAASSGAEDSVAIPLYQWEPLAVVALENNSEWVLARAELDGHAPVRLFLTVELHNRGMQQLDLKDYWMYVNDKEGRNYPLLLEPSATTRVVPQGKGTFVFYAEVGDSAVIDDFSVRVIRWDFNSLSLEQELQVIGIPASHSVTAPPGMGLRLESNGIDVAIQPHQVIAGSGNGNVPVTVYVKAENLGRNEVTLTDRLQFAIESADGLLFVLKEDTGQQIKTIAPKSVETIRVTGNVSQRSDLDGASLVVREAAGTSIARSIARISLPWPANQGAIGAREMEFSTADGVYVIRLEQINRVPWEDKDLLQSVFTITAKEDTLLPVPQLSGYYLLGDQVKVQASFSQHDSIGVSQRNGARLVATGNIPYLFDHDQTGFILEETRDGSTDELVRFSNQPVNERLPSVRMGRTHQTADSGASVAYTAKRSYSYYSGSSKLYMVQIEAVNQEKRVVSPQELTGYFQLENGALHPVRIEQTTERVSAGGKRLLQVWAVFPEDADLEQIKLILGTRGQTTVETREEAPYVLPVSYLLPVETEPNDSFSNMLLEPYQLSMSRYKVRYDYYYGEWTFALDYELKKDAWLQADTKDYQIWIEIEDNKGQVVYEERLELDNNNVQAALRIGRHTYEFKRTDRETGNNLRNNGHTLKIFVTFQGYKRLLTEKTVYSSFREYHLD